MYDDDELEDDNIEEEVEEEYSSEPNVVAKTTSPSNTQKNTSPAVTGVKNKAKQAAKKGAKQTVKVLGAALKKLLVAALANPVVTIIIIVAIIVFAAICWILVIKSSETVQISVDKYMEQNKDSLDSAIKDDYEKKNSLLSMKLSEIDKMYNIFITDTDSKEKVTISDLKKKYSGGDSSNPSKGGSLSVNESRELYKHILMTEKYNFNSIEWNEYSHDRNGTEPPMEVNKDNGLRFPSIEGDHENSFKEDYFTKFAYPYLQNWYIPLAMYSGTLSPSNSEDSRKNGQFAYQIISKAYSDILINKFVLEKKTKVYEKYNYVITKVPIMAQVSCSELTIPGTTIDGILGPSTTIYTNCHITNMYEGEGTNIPVVTDDKEISSRIDKTTQYKLIRAMTFDRAFKFEYEYTKYGEAPDVINVKTESINDRPDGTDPVNGMAYAGGLRMGASGAAYGGAPGTYTVGYYSTRNGNRYETTKIWQDRLTQKNGTGKGEVYKVSDLVDFINNKKYGDPTTIANSGASSLTDEQIAAATKDYDTLISATQKAKIKGKKVFICPSIQWGGASTSPWAADGSTIEGIYMQRTMYPLVKGFLEKLGIEVSTYKFSTEDRGDWDTHALPISKGGQVPDDISAFLALHSNGVGSGEAQTIARGQMMLYTTDEGKKLSEYVATSVQKLYNLTEPDAGVSYKYQDDNELVQPPQPASLIEIGYHDNIADGQWMLNNADKIAKSISNGIIGYLLGEDVSNNTTSSGGAQAGIGTQSINTGAQAGIGTGTGTSTGTAKTTTPNIVNGKIALTEKAQKYYEGLAKKEKLDRLDFINATRKIYGKYIKKGEEWDENVGYQRGYLSFSYTLLKKMLSTIGDDPNNLPFVYGQSLGLNKNHNFGGSTSGAGLGGLIWPVEVGTNAEGKATGSIKITSLWGYQYDRASFIEKSHSAIDIVDEDGTGSLNIVAAHSGTVRSGLPGYGCIEIVGDEGKYVTEYMHMSNILVNPGEHVTQGQIIGVMGGMGRRKSKCISCTFTFCSIYR
jgi:murein DD-endopeptidase MepM/ murein hydrolase activator NlpD